MVIVNIIEIAKKRINANLAITTNIIASNTKIDARLMVTINANRITSNIIKYMPTYK